MVADQKKNTVRRTVIIIAAAVALLASVAAFLLLKRQPDTPAVPESYTVELTLLGDAVISVEYGDTFQDPGVEAVGYGTVNTDPIKLDVAVSHDVDSQKLGSYTVTYTAEYKGVSRTAKRQVKVVDTTPPEIQLVSNPESYTLPGQAYEEEGYTAVDLHDGELTGKVQRTEADGVVTYQVADSSGNVAQVQRKIRYYDPEPPVMTLLGAEKITLYAGDSWADSGCTAMDNVDGDITHLIQVTGEVQRYISGTYVLTYQVTDSFGNTASVERTVIVKGLTPPATVEPNGKVIYLTFDDGPSEYTKDILQILDKYQVKATFFVVNTKNISMIREMSAAGHTIAIHSKTHRYERIYASDDAFFEDLYAMQDIIYRYTGIRTNMLRFPGGSSNRVSIKYNTGIMTRLVQAVQSMGFQYFDWNVDSGDAGGATTADEVYNNVVEGVKEHKHAVVLMHDTTGYTVDALDRIIHWGLRNGYSFEVLTETSPPCHHTWIKN